MAKEKAIRCMVVVGICCVGVFLFFSVKFLIDRTPVVRTNKDGTIEIREKLFIAQTNEILLNSEDYIGRTIRVEGLFKTLWYDGVDEPYCFVVRYGPGCCAYDGNAGFEVAWSPPTETPDVTVLSTPYPGEDDWVEAVGTLSSYEEDGYPYLYLQLKSLTVKDERGAEYVTQ